MPDTITTTGNSVAWTLSKIDVPILADLLSTVADMREHTEFEVVPTLTVKSDKIKLGLAIGLRKEQEDQIPLFPADNTIEMHTHPRIRRER